MSKLSKLERSIKFGQPGKSNPMFGKHHSEEIKNIISIKRLGSSPPNKGRPLEEMLGQERAKEIKKRCLS